MVDSFTALCMKATTVQLRGCLGSLISIKKKVRFHQKKPLMLLVFKIF